MIIRLFRATLGPKERARTAFASSSRTAHEMIALARPFAPVSRALRFPVHGSLLTKNFAGLLNAPPGNGKPAYIPDFQ